MKVSVPVTREYAVCDLRSLKIFLSDDLSVRDDPLPTFCRCILNFVFNVKNITC